MQAKYTQGETIEFSVPDGGYDSVVVNYGAGASAALSKSDGVWSGVVQSAALSGPINYAVLATTGASTVAVERGAFRVCPLRSQYWEVVEAIDAALQGVAVNGKYSISVGDISLTDKTFDEMIKFSAYYRGLAQEEESGEAVTGRVGIIRARF